MSQRENGTFSRADFVFDPERDVYTCPRGKLLRTTGRIHDGRTLLYRASKHDSDLYSLIEVLAEQSRTEDTARRE
jgi:hypothetical protein